VIIVMVCRDLRPLGKIIGVINVFKCGLQNDVLVPKIVVFKTPNFAGWRLLLVDILTRSIWDSRK